MADREEIVVPRGFKVIETEGDIFDAPEESLLIRKAAFSSILLVSRFFDWGNAVNCQGLWGSGIADAFKRKYPAAFEVYKSHCKEKSRLSGTCLLIPPQIEDYRSSIPADKDEETRPKCRKVAAKPVAKKHWIGCLFTSYNYGKPTKYKAGKDSPEDILKNTRAALKDLRQQVESLETQQLDPEPEGVDNGKDTLVGMGGNRGKRNGPADGDPCEMHVSVNVILGSLFACKFNSGSFGVDWKDTRALIEEVFDGYTGAMHVVSPPTRGD